jgi:hypothetical protein
MSVSDGISQVRKGDVSISIEEGDRDITVTCAPEDLLFVKTAIHETLMRLDESIAKLKQQFDPESMRKEIAAGGGRKDKAILRHLKDARVIPNLKAKTKEGAIKEMVASLAKAGLLLDQDKVLADVFEREKLMSTGMQHGIALPHGKSDGTKGLHVVVALSREESTSVPWTASRPRS